MQPGRADPATGEQERLDSYFSEHATDWADIYQRDDLQAVIHQQRLRILLDWTKIIAPSGKLHALEVGCGVGLAAVALAERGYSVEAIDTVPAMLERTSTRAMAAGQQARVRVRQGDVRGMPFADDMFDLVVALGVLPWLHSIDQALLEIVRVLRPGGYLVVTMDNQWSLPRVVDPLRNPLLNPAKSLAWKILQRLGRARAAVRPHPMSLRKFDAKLHAAGFEIARSVTLGFGPFRIFDHDIMSNRAALKVHRFLQDLVDRDLPVPRCGSQYMVLAWQRYQGQTVRPSSSSLSKRCFGLLASRTLTF
jgi:ubiquinone/menaquinone biosynthesis C-methylase UbiE